MVIAPSDLNRIVRQASVMADDENSGVLFDLSEGRLVVSMPDGESSKRGSRVSLPTRVSRVKPFLNHWFVRDICKACEASPMMKMYLRDDASSVRFEDDHGYVGVVMPMHPE